MKLLPYINSLSSADKIAFAKRVASHTNRGRTTIVSLRNVAYQLKKRITADLAVAIEFASDGAVPMEDLQTTFPVKEFLAFRNRKKKGV